jgi:hypothetical protein
VVVARFVWWMGSTDEGIGAHLLAVVQRSVTTILFEHERAFRLLGSLRSRHHIRSGPHLSPLTLEASNSLLPPLGSHLEY